MLRIWLWNQRYIIWLSVRERRDSLQQFRQYFTDNIRIRLALGKLHYLALQKIYCHGLAGFVSLDGLRICGDDFGAQRNDGVRIAFLSHALVFNDRRGWLARGKHFGEY